MKNERNKLHSKVKDTLISSCVSSSDITGSLCCDWVITGETKLSLIFWDKRLKYFENISRCRHTELSFHSYSNLCIVTAALYFNANESDFLWMFPNFLAVSVHKCWPKCQRKLIIQQVSALIQKTKNKNIEEKVVD